MSHDWPWLVVLALVVPPALGHLYHFVLMVNVGSGLGMSEPMTDKMRDLLFVILAITSAILFWMHLRSPWWTWGWPLWSYAVLCAVSGALIGPLNSLLIALRRRPSGIEGSSLTVDFAQQAGTEALIGPGHRASLLRLPGNESFRLQLREWNLVLPQLPPALEGLRIVQITDLHIAPCFNRRFFEGVIGACLDWRADLVVMTGDLVEDDEIISWVEPLLSPLEARLGKFAILGNHDNEHQPRTIAGELERAGFEMLEGRWTTLDVNGSALALGGTSQPWGPGFASSDVPPADFHVLLSHSPDQFYKAQRWGVDLMLSGHNHGGQIRLPLVGPVFMPSRYSRRFDRGFFRQNGTLLYVNEGVGGKHPVRYGCPPEVSRFVLHAATDHIAPDDTTAFRSTRKPMEQEWVKG
jgi:predicted MPP superfamily phosphohydrolase